MPSVAVVIPAYNAEATLARTLASVVDQTMGDFELVVTDDGSKDSTYEIAVAFARRDSRVTVIRQPNLGIADARNTGIRNSRAPLIAALDSDDLWHPTFLERLASTFREDPETVMAYTNSRIIDMGDRVIWSAPSFQRSGWVFNQLLLQNFVGNGSATMFRRDLAMQLGLYERELQYRYGAAGCDDWLLALRLAAYGKVAVVHEYLVGYRSVPGSMSSNTLRTRRSRLAALQMLFAEIDVASTKPARWALGNAHVKCFLHELRALQLRPALKDLAAGLRLDFAGALRLFVGSERLDWLMDKLPWLADAEPTGPFMEFDTRDGQWEELSPRAEWASRWDREVGRVATRWAHSRVAGLGA